MTMPALIPCRCLIRAGFAQYVIVDEHSSVTVKVPYAICDSTQAVSVGHAVVESSTVKLRVEHPQGSVTAPVSHRDKKGEHLVSR